MTVRTLVSSAVLALCVGVPQVPAIAAPDPTPAPTTSSAALGPEAPGADAAPSAPSGATGEFSAPAVAQCVAAHDNAGLLRLKDQWVDARAAMQRCANDACPITIRSDCRAWLDELVAMLPTLLVVVERDDDGTRAIRLDLDGRSLELPEKLGPIEVVPGPHRLHFTLEGYPPVDVDVALSKGEKNHVVRVRFVRPRPAVAPERAVAPSPPRATRPVPLATYLYAGGSLALVATSAALLGAALDSRATARDVCAPGCPTERRESIERRLLIVDLVGIAGLGLGGLAVYSYVRRPWVTDPAVSAGISVALAPDRAGLSVAGSF
jgi:hypothetical protein